MELSDLSWMHYVIEFVTYGFAALMIRHAWTATEDIERSDTATHPSLKARPRERRGRGRWLSSLLWGVVFGQIIEGILITAGGYEYGHFVVMMPNLLDPGRPVPLWIGVGWGVIIYASAWTARRLKQPSFASAVVAGLLAVSFDLSLDPVAHKIGLWTWPKRYADYYGVPFDNFIGWFLIVTSYTLSVSLLYRSRLSERPSATLWIPPIGIGLSLAFVVTVDHFLPFAYRLVGGDAPVFGLVFAAACFVVVRHARRAPAHDLAPSWPVLAVPLVYHALCWAFLVIAYVGGGSQLREQVASLLVVIPIIAAMSLLAYGWASLDQLFPHECAPQSGDA